MEGTKGHFVKLLVEPWGEQWPKRSLFECVGCSLNVRTRAMLSLFSRSAVPNVN